MARTRREEEDRNGNWGERQVQKRLAELTGEEGTEGLLHIMARLRVKRSGTFRRLVDAGFERLVDAEFERLVDAEFERLQRYAEKALRQTYDV